MKLYRILYWVGSVWTERYIRASSAEDARSKFVAWRNGLADGIIAVKEGE
jgi:hypothetical protein